MHDINKIGFVKMKTSQLLKNRENKRTKIIVSTHLIDCWSGFTIQKYSQFDDRFNPVDYPCELLKFTESTDSSNREFVSNNFYEMDTKSRKFKCTTCWWYWPWRCLVHSLKFVCLSKECGFCSFILFRSQFSEMNQCCQRTW